MMAQMVKVILLFIYWNMRMKAAILVFIVGNVAITRYTLSLWESTGAIDHSLENTNNLPMDSSRRKLGNLNLRSNDFIDRWFESTHSRFEYVSNLGFSLS